MIKIRIGAFETNSSSTHTLCIATDEEYKKLLTGELLISLINDKFVTLEEAINQLYDANKREEMKNWSRHDILDELREDYIAKTFDDYMENEYLERYDEVYTTPKGETLHVFGLFGRDG